MINSSNKPISSESVLNSIENLPTTETRPRDEKLELKQSQQLTKVTSKCYKSMQWKIQKTERVLEIVDELSDLLNESLLSNIKQVKHLTGQLAGSSIFDTDQS